MSMLQTHNALYFSVTSPILRLKANLILKQICIVNTFQKQQFNTFTTNRNLTLKIQIYTIQYNTIQYNTIQYNTIQYNTIQYNTIKSKRNYFLISKLLTNHFKRVKNNHDPNTGIQIIIKGSIQFHNDILSC